MQWMNRTLNQATAAAIAAFMLASAAQADDPVRLRLNWMYYGSHAGFAYGKDKGYYKDVGIDLDIRSGNGSTSSHRLVANGDSTFSYGTCASMVILATQGAPLISVGVIDAMGTEAIIVHPESGIKDIKGLKGKSLLTTANAPIFKRPGERSVSWAVSTMPRPRSKPMAASRRSPLPIPTMA
jgi:NitT/TauT family transport system substrate-binding protein